ncbi:hypothetical protein M8494_10610 [Serratia ureilytica]
MSIGAFSDFWPEHAPETAVTVLAKNTATVARRKPLAWRAGRSPRRCRFA